MRTLMIAADVSGSALDQHRSAHFFTYSHVSYHQGCGLRVCVLA